VDFYVYNNENVCITMCALCPRLLDDDNLETL